MGGDPKEYTQRTRSFLYASFGTALANRLGISEVSLADNGFVSLALPVNDQLVGTRISRSTHPRFLRLFNELASLVFRGAMRVVNPLWQQTRVEALRHLIDAGTPELVEVTNSCAHRRNLTKMQPHCGVCSQCIDRRFATLAAGLEEFDPEDAYDVRIFRDHLEEGSARTAALSYVRFANRLAKLSGEQFFLEFPELYDCVPTDSTQKTVAEGLVSLLERHAATVLHVAEDQIASYKTELAREELPPACLIRLLAGSGEAIQAWFRHGPDYREIWLGDRRVPLTPNQAGVVAYMDSLGDTSASESHILEKAEIRSRNLHQVFRNTPGVLGTLIVKGDGKGTFRLNRMPQR